MDTGALYRAVALAAQRAASLGTTARRSATLASGWSNERAVELGKHKPAAALRCKLRGEDVSLAIREPSVSQGASKVSAVPAVREALLDMQRAAGADGGVVLEGRDIGTVVFPNAEAKFFLTASVDVRARRRFDELLGARRACRLRRRCGARSPSVICATARARSRRSNKPPTPSIIDSSVLTIDQVVARIVSARARSGSRARRSRMTRLGLSRACCAARSARRAARAHVGPPPNAPTLARPLDCDARRSRSWSCASICTASATPWALQRWRRIIEQAVHGLHGADQRDRRAAPRRARRDTTRCGSGARQRALDAADTRVRDGPVTSRISIPNTARRARRRFGAHRSRRRFPALRSRVAQGRASAPARIYTRGDDLVVSVSEAEIDSVERSLEEAARRAAARARGKGRAVGRRAAAACCRSELLAASPRSRGWPSAPRRCELNADLTSAGVDATLGLKFEDPSSAERVGHALSGSARRAAERARAAREVRRAASKSRTPPSTSPCDFARARRAVRAGQLPRLRLRLVRPEQPCRPGAARHRRARRGRGHRAVFARVRGYRSRWRLPVAYDLLQVRRLWPSGGATLPDDTVLAARIDVETVLISDPVRSRLLPLFDQGVAARRAQGAPRPLSRAHRRRAGPRPA